MGNSFTDVETYQYTLRLKRTLADFDNFYMQHHDET